jgi:hypothetical protein
MQHHPQANHTEVLVTDAYNSLGYRRNIDGCHTESRGLLRRAFLVSSCWEALSVQARHQNRWTDFIAVWVLPSLDYFQVWYTT